MLNLEFDSENEAVEEKLQIKEDNIDLKEQLESVLSGDVIEEVADKEWTQGLFGELSTEEQDDVDGQ